MIMSVQLRPQATIRPKPVETPDSELRRRQTKFGFIRHHDVGSDNCSEASLFHRSGGQLHFNGRPISVNPGVAYISLLDYPDGSITTSFSIVDDILVWSNQAFYDGQASFCQQENGDVFGIFQETGAPSDCMPVNLHIYRGDYGPHCFLSLFEV